jgi:beta-1,2-mannobiose phosphorylase / 1,2-beta-oligomannan phosphorylase
MKMISFAMKIIMGVFNFLIMPIAKNKTIKNTKVDSVLIKKRKKIITDVKKIPKSYLKKIADVSSCVKKSIVKKLEVKKVSKKIKLKSPVLKNEKVFSSKNIKLKKIPNNPIISPSFYSWESKATFNPAALIYDGKVHLIYRAIGEDDSSVLGYAASYDGLNIEDRPSYFVYKRFQEFIKSGKKLEYDSGGGWDGGCEDPRLTLIDDTIYLIFTAFDGWSSIRLALTSISLSDFKNKKWNWKKTVLISPPGEIHKNWVLFPEKINGKFAIMHSISPNILIEYFDDLDELNGNNFIKSYYHNKPNWGKEWHSKVRGIGPTPIKIDEGWLVFYHAMDKNDPDKYKLGAMILDYKDPTKILHISKNPILEPEEEYENNGLKWGVIYSCGAVVKDNEVLVYYGGSDQFCCVAKINLNELVEGLKNTKQLKLKKVNKKNKK